MINHTTALRARKFTPFGGWRHMNKPLWGLRVDGPLGRRFLRGLSLTRLWREGCCRAPLNYRRRPFIKNLYNRPAGEEMHFPPLVPYGTTFPALRGGTMDA